MSSEKAFTRARVADRATMHMVVHNDSCGGAACPNPPIASIGKRLICGDCLRRMQGAWPQSYERYWAPKLAWLGKT